MSGRDDLPQLRSGAVLPADSECPLHVDAIVDYFGAKSLRPGPGGAQPRKQPTSDATIATVRPSRRTGYGEMVDESKEEKFGHERATPLAAGLVARHHFIFSTPLRFPRHQSITPPHPIQQRPFPRNRPELNHFDAACLDRFDTHLVPP